MIREKQYPLAELRFDEEENLLFLKVKQDITIDVAEINEMIDYVKEFVGSKKHFAVIDFGESVNSSNESRKVYAESNYLLEFRLADAFIVRSLPIKLVANFFIRVTQPSIKTKSFTSEAAAKEWIESLRISENSEQ